MADFFLSFPVKSIELKDLADMKFSFILFLSFEDKDNVELEK